MWSLNEKTTITTSNTKHKRIKMEKLRTTFIKIRNKLLLYLGFTLVNKHGHTVHLIKGQQIMSNPKRIKPYSLDDPSWRIQKGI